MDEPTANLDINYQIETLDLARQLCQKQNFIIIVTLHDLNLASQYCDRLVVFYNGSVYCQGTPKSVINAQTIKEVYGAEVHVYPHPINNLPATLIISDRDRKEFD